MFFEEIFFKNKEDGRIEKVANDTYIFSLIAGPIFFAFKRSWTHFFIHILLTLSTFGIGWVFYSIFSKSVIVEEYLQRGWKQVNENGKSVSPSVLRQTVKFSQKRLYILLPIPILFALLVTLIVSESIVPEGNDDPNYETKTIEYRKDEKISDKTIYITTYFEWPTILKIPYKENKTLTVQYAISTQYDDIVMSNAEIHNLAITGSVLKQLADLKSPDIYSSNGISEITNVILEATNETLVKLEDFGGIEEVYLIAISFD